MAHQYEVTSVGVNPVDDRAYRIRTYFIVMTIRVLCVVSLFWVRGWWLLLVGVLAVVLPYVAMLIANAVSHQQGNILQGVDPLAIVSLTPIHEDQVSQHTIVIEAPTQRKTDTTEGKD